MLLIVGNVVDKRNNNNIGTTSLVYPFLVFLFIYISNNNNNHKINTSEIHSRRTLLFEQTISQNLKSFNVSDERECGRTRRQLDARFNCTTKQVPVLGESSIPGLFPSHAILYCGLNGKHRSICNGILINRELVLTSAACIKGNNYCRGRFGFLDGLDRKYEQHEFVWGYCILKNFTSDNHNDVALLQLSMPIQFNDNIRPACLDMSNSKFESSTCTSVGFSKSTNSQGQDTTKLKFVKMIDKCNSTKYDSIGRTCYMPSKDNLCEQNNKGSGLYCLSNCTSSSRIKQYAIGLFSFKEKDERIANCQQSVLIGHFFSDFNKLRKNLTPMLENCHEFLNNSSPREW